ncbi:monovalent cation/H(+) antiporter subunit G [Corynebacterium epidermidicanis]|uniref:Multisubunit Na+/H+ antiporter, MnhG subunit n=1 Tax=Corynebacterium epidermidicanis TaxID=1050174 RepID=A0A0G3GTZ2_9CORY|nr:monovalent cation/H(+) antiporter subunit G [Corynebacterium epidermidicanis]AKK04015.1 multisubunit Na+/H+ antiporter, MnhG subunit [Corynebacterium epidermidicanis]
MSLLCDIISITCIFAGAFLVLATAIGMARFRDTVSRLHSVTKPQTLGLILTVIGAIVRILGRGDLTPGNKGDLGTLVLVILFALCTAPVVGQRIGRIARREQLYDATQLARNDRS